MKESFLQSAVYGKDFFMKRIWIFTTVILITPVILFLLCALTFCLLFVSFWCRLPFSSAYSPLYSFRKMTLYPQKQTENKTKLINRTCLYKKCQTARASCPAVWHFLSTYYSLLFLAQRHYSLSVLVRYYGAAAVYRY